MIGRGGGQSAGGTFLESRFAPAHHNSWRGPLGASQFPHSHISKTLPPTIHAGPPGEVGIGTQGCRGATTCRPARPFAVVSESTAHEYRVLTSF